MYKLSLFGILMLAMCCQPLSALPSHTLSDALALTVLNNPQLNAFNYDLRANDAMILQAGIRPNPALDVETENIGTPIFMQTTFMLSQLIELGGKRSARLKFARTDRDRTFLDYEVKKRQLFVDTTLLYIDVLINQQKIVFLEDNLQVLQKFSSVVEKRVQAGKASVIEEANFSVLLTTAYIDLKNAQNEFKNAKIKLAAQWGETNIEQFSAIGNLEWLPTVIPLEQIGCMIHHHPQIMRSNIEGNFREARIAVEKSKAYPDINLRGGPRYLNEVKQWVWVIGFYIPLPFNDRNQGRIWEANVNWEKIERETEAIWVKLLTDLNTSYATMQTLSSELDLLRNTILPAAQKAYDFSYKGYESARYNYLELLETERLYRSSKIRYLIALGDYHKALAVLEGLTGSKEIFNNQCE
ncbi:MAG TPA: TolC family protein [Parachlamydiaceae bacterium]|nr:TolC family protein [Parachlamydiaceae bacterium]